MLDFRACRHLTFAVGISVGFTSFATGQQAVRGNAELPSERAAALRPITVEEVIQLHKAGVSEAVLLTRIKQAKKALILSTEEILKLKEAKVSDRVVQALMDPSLDNHLSASQTSVTAPVSNASQIVGPVQPQTMIAGINLNRPSGATPDSQTPAGDSNDPNAPHDSGIYI